MTPAFSSSDFNAHPVGQTPFSKLGKPCILMCPPHYFNLAYAINPWMNQSIPIDQPLAQQQWEKLAKTVEKAGAHVEILDPVEGLPDIVFTANAAFVYNNIALIARYRHPERQPEEDICADWFTEKGFEVYRLPDEFPLEGAGEALIWKNKVFASHGSRGHIESHPLLAKLSGLEIISLELTDPRYYHIDVCLCPLADGSVLYAPSVFTAEGNSLIEAHVSPQKRIQVSAEDAARFACNTISINETVIFAQGSPAVEEAFRTRGFNVMTLDLSEFIKSGGSAKCLSLRIA